MVKEKSPVLAFDLGMVIFGFDYNLALEKIKGKINVDPGFILSQLSANKFGMDFEKGLIGSRDFYNQFRDNYQAKITYDEFVDIWCDIFYAHHEVIALIQKLIKKYNTYLISNINELHYEFLYKKYPKVFSLFDGLILSYKVKSVKPEIEIYNKLSELAKAEFKDIIYIDDRLDLIDCANSYGLNARQYKSIEKLRFDLKSLSVTVD